MDHESRILTPALQQQLTSARELLAELRDALTRFGAGEADRDALAASIRQLDEFFLLVVVGEFNAGKSAFINALAGPARAPGRRHADDRRHSSAEIRRHGHLAR